MNDAERSAHIAHCYQGEYKNTCKYGDDNCPGKINRPTRYMLKSDSRIGGRNAVAGAYVYSVKGTDYGLASADTRNTGAQHISVTLDREGAKPSFTHLMTGLQRAPYPDEPEYHKGVATSTPYGYCPICGDRGATRERRPNGNDTCVKAHTYPSCTARAEPPKLVNEPDPIAEAAVNPPETDEPGKLLPYICGCFLNEVTSPTTSRQGYRCGLVWAVSREEAVGKFAISQMDAHPNATVSQPDANRMTDENILRTAALVTPAIANGLAMEALAQKNATERLYNEAKDQLAAYHDAAPYVLQKFDPWTGKTSGQEEALELLRAADAKAFPPEAPAEQ